MRYSALNMSDNIKLAYSENEIVSPSVVISTAQNPSSPVPVTNKSSAEDSGIVSSENSSAGIDGTSQEATQSTSSGSKTQTDEDVANKSSSNTDAQETTSKTGEVSESTEALSVCNEERNLDETSDEALETSPVKKSHEKLPAKKRQSRKTEGFSSLASVPLGVGGKTKRGQAEKASRLVFVQRLSRLPVVRCSAGLYQQAKGNQLLGGTLELVESCVWLTSRPLALTSSLFEGMCSTPVGVADWVLCKVLDVAQTVCPCVAVPPNQMCGAMVDGAKNCVCCCPRTFASGMKTVCAKAKSICN